MAKKQQAKKQHEHEYVKGPYGKLAVCRCGAFKHLVKSDNVATGIRYYEFRVVVSTSIGGLVENAPRDVLSERLAHVLMTPEKRAGGLAVESIEPTGKQWDKALGSKAVSDEKMCEWVVGELVKAGFDAHYEHTGANWSVFVDEPSRPDAEWIFESRDDWEGCLLSKEIGTLWGRENGGETVVLNTDVSGDSTNARDIATALAEALTEWRAVPTTVIDMNKP